jgi:hypothetical protein
MRFAGTGDAAWLLPSLSPERYARRVKIRSSRRRVRRAEPPPTEPTEPQVVGARSPGVR